MLHAVVIGIDEYADPEIPPLGCAVADARAVASLLEERIAPDERKVQVLCNREATLRNISLAIDEELTSSVGEDDVVFIYFAGHGSPANVSYGDRLARYLLPCDADARRIHATSLGMESAVSEWLKRLSLAKVVFVVLDCCFSGRAGGRTLLFSSGKSKTLTGQLVSLRGLNLGRGRVILCAADDDQLAAEEPASGHGILTHHLLAALTRPRATPQVLLTDLYTELFTAVSAATDGSQEPVITAISKNAAFPSLPSPTPTATRR